MLPYFYNPDHALRDTVYSEKFTPNGTGPYTSHERTVRNERYKLIRRTGQADELFDLQLDAFEAAPLAAPLSIAQQSAYDSLVAAMVQLGVN